MRHAENLNKVFDNFLQNFVVKNIKTKKLKENCKSLLNILKQQSKKDFKSSQFNWFCKVRDTNILILEPIERKDFKSCKSDRTCNF